MKALEASGDWSSKRSVQSGEGRAAKMLRSTDLVDVERDRSHLGQVAGPSAISKTGASDEFLRWKSVNRHPETATESQV